MKGIHMRPLLRTGAGLATAVALLIALAACGGIEVVSGSMELNSGVTYCRYNVVPRRVVGTNGQVDFWPVWRNTVYASQKEFQDVKSICIPDDCSVSANDCRDPGLSFVQVKTNFTDEPYQLASLPCSKTCSGYLGKW